VYQSYIGQLAGLVLAFAKGFRRSVHALDIAAAHAIALSIWAEFPAALGFRSFISILFKTQLTT
jgi:hypothetical protein